jgi:hypothetical protein
VRRLAVQQRRAFGGALEAERDAHERGLPAAVRACDGDELALAETEIDLLEDPLARPIAERDARELNR